MKTVKATNQGIVTDYKGTVLDINSAGIVVSDEVAADLSVQFGHTIEVTDFIEETPVAPAEEVSLAKADEIPAEVVAEVAPEAEVVADAAPQEGTNVSN